MPLFLADLHNHTPASADHHQRSGVTARDIVESALDAGLDIYAATDHLSWDYSASLIDAAAQVALETGRHLLVVPGVEMRITHRGDEVHLVALFDQERYATLLQTLLEIFGVAGRLPKEADLPAYTFEYDPVQACRTIDALGGIAIVAHADRTFGSYRVIDSPLMARLIGEPTMSAIDLVDIEGARGRLDGCGKTLISCSDSHSCGAIGARRVALEMAGLSFESLREALAPLPVAEIASGSYREPTLKLA